jgi:hypothetical protein
MSETSTHKSSENGKRTIPADAQNAAFLYTSTFAKEGQRVLEETASAMEKSFAEYERGLAEMNRMALANAKLMHEASRAWFEGVRVVMQNVSKNGQV